MECIECYSKNHRITPLLGARNCLEHHLQYICGTCGRCICIEKDKVRGLQRWNFPFKSLEIAKLYLRTADYTTKQSCHIYEIESNNGRMIYKIFIDEEELKKYLEKNKNKRCKENKVLFTNKEYIEFPRTKVQYLSQEEVEQYLKERG